MLLLNEINLVNKREGESLPDCNQAFFTDSQLKDLEDNLSEIVSSCDFVDKAIDSATSTQLLLVRKQVS